MRATFLNGACRTWRVVLGVSQAAWRDGLLSLAAAKEGLSQSGFESEIACKTIIQSIGHFEFLTCRSTLRLRASEFWVAESFV